MARLEHDLSWPRLGMVRLEHVLFWPRLGMVRLEHDLSWPRLGMVWLKHNLFWPGLVMKRQWHDLFWRRLVMPWQKISYSFFGAVFLLRDIKFFAVKTQLRFQTSKVMGKSLFSSASTSWLLMHSKPSGMGGMLASKFSTKVWTRVK